MVVGLLPWGIVGCLKTNKQKFKVRQPQRAAKSKRPNAPSDGSKNNGIHTTKQEEYPNRHPTTDYPNVGRSVPCAVTNSLFDPLALTVCGAVVAPKPPLSASPPKCAGFQTVQNCCQGFCIWSFYGAKAYLGEDRRSRVRCMTVQPCNLAAFYSL